ncbi:MAG: hypothetical protein O3A93_00960 [Chloroflexi bacterium]|nr:hypothetical protein [Chloroflexota bacterium]MDA1269815.1 hypothetical protein [Chloroflexota bacterium]PKB58466.1 MAG: hypothetical protein BZY83_06915 [SAR202 cluster bacterium Casp-Chloro-G2]
MLEHNGLRWGYVFLKGAAYLSAEEFQSLMVQAVEMFLAGETERNVRSAEYEGRLYTERRYELIGTIGGQRFNADLETSRGHDNASFLVNEQTHGTGGSISVN